MTGWAPDVCWMTWDDRDKHTLLKKNDCNKILCKLWQASFDKQALTSKSQQTGQPVPCSLWSWYWVCFLRRLEVLLVLLVLIVELVAVVVAQHWVSDCCGVFVFVWAILEFWRVHMTFIFEVIGIHQMPVEFRKWFWFDRMLFVIELWDFQNLRLNFWKPVVVNICDFGWDDWFWEMHESFVKSITKDIFLFHFVENLRWVFALWPVFWHFLLLVRFCWLTVDSCCSLLLLGCVLSCFMTMRISTRTNTKENCLLRWSTPITNMAYPRCWLHSSVFTSMPFTRTTVSSSHF